MRSFLICAAVVTTVVACNTGGLSTPPGTQCADGYAPVPMTAPAQKLTLNTSQNKANAADPNAAALRPGVYKYSTADLWYVQNATAANPQPLQVQVRDSENGDGVTSSQAIICVRNAKASMTGISAQADSVTDITVNPDYTTSVVTRHFTFDITDTKINVQVPIVNAQVAADPSALIANNPQKINDYFMQQNSATDFEMHIAYQSPDPSYSYFLAIHMTYYPVGQLPPGAPPGTNGTPAPAAAAAPAAVPAPTTK